MTHTETLEEAALRITKTLERAGCWLWQTTVQRLTEQFPELDTYDIMKAATQARRITRGMRGK